MPDPAAPFDGNDVMFHVVRHSRSLISVIEVAQWLGVSERHVYNLAEDGTLEKHTLGAEGRAVRITRRSLIKFLLESANYKPGDESGYEMLIALLLNDLSDHGVRRAALRCQKILSAREHARNLHAPSQDQGSLL